ncbi:MAG: glycosyltransferase family 1 protein [Verrucomicrobiaceae bacterium]|nr:MAG: glycosyltransferase family 1 protein [Verrucomicrobiaceae bacterium]
MKVGLFALEIGRNVGGLEVYETELIRALAKIDQENQYVIFCLDPCVPEILQLNASNFEYRILQTGRLKGVIYDAPRAMAREGLDLFHAMFVPPPFTAIPYVFTHHGSEVIERPEFYPFLLGLRMRLLFKRAFRKARLIICVSDYVRDYLRAKQRIPTNRLQRVYNGCRPSFRSCKKSDARKEVAHKYGLSFPYLITVGRIEPRKNPIRVLEAYNIFRRQVPGAPKLVFAGMKTWSGQDFDRTVERLGLADKIIQLGYVDDADLPQLYSASEFALFTSLWEGFGLPVLEAFATATPLITSNTTSLPEVAGDAAVLVNPYSVEEIAAAMRSLYENLPLQEQLAREGQTRSAEFTWERSARETISAYAFVAFGNNVNGASQLHQGSVDSPAETL